MHSLDALKKEVERLMPQHDAAHDFSHVLRVANIAKELSIREGANMTVTIPAALLHDIAPQDKHSVEKRRSSADASAGIAKNILEKHGFDGDAITKILYAIRVHSFSKGIVPETLEAKVLQDADRLDAIGTIGIARLFAVCGTWKGHRIYCIEDPFAEKRTLDESKYSLDHYFIKLAKIRMNTPAGEELAAPRREFMRAFIEQLKKEI